MKKLIRLLFNISNILFDFLMFLLFVVSMCLTVFIVRPKIENKIFDFSSVNMTRIGIWVSLLFLVLIIINLSIVINNELCKRGYLFYSLSLTEKESSFFVFWELLKVYYIYMLVGIVIAVPLKMPLKVTLLLLSAVYLVLYMSIFRVVMHHLKNPKYFKLFSVFHKSLNRHSNMERKSNAMLELIRIELRKRSLNISSVALKLVLMFATLASIKMQCGDKVFLGITLLIVMVFILTNDVYWLKESINLEYYSEIGVPFKKFLLINLISSYIYDVALNLIIYAIYTRNLIYTLILFIVSGFQLVYWTLTYIYVSKKMKESSEMFKVLIYICFIVLSLIPIVNIIQLVITYKKANNLWEERAYADY